MLKTNPSTPTSVARASSLTDALNAARETRALEMGPGALNKTALVFQQLFPGKKARVVSDPTTLVVAGNQVIAQLAAAGVETSERVILSDPGLYAEFRFVEQLEAIFKTDDAIPIAVGSGTINDLVKLAAFRTGRPYLCVATAASMDGYTAFGASITYQGSKQTFDCPAPTGVIADTDVIRRAPPAMTASGYADLLAKIPAGADWIVADLLQVEPIDRRIWDIVQGGLRTALADPAGAHRGDAVAIGRLTEGLMLGGFAMQGAKSSRPASGAEHQFSHLWDMEHHVHNGAAPPHGFKVGVATRAVVTFYEELLSRPLDQLDVERACASAPTPAQIEAKIRALFGETDFLARAMDETKAKTISRDQLRAQLTRLKQVWPELVQRLRVQLPASNDLKTKLQVVGAPFEPEQIGISRARLRDSFVRAYYIRRRFTVLDLAMHTGVFDDVLSSLFGRGGPWDVTQTSARSSS